MKGSLSKLGANSDVIENDIKVDDPTRCAETLGEKLKRA
jgi:hypothetical protein